MVKTVAIVGASSDRRKFGNKALRAFRHQGHRVVPINPNEREVEGEPCHASVLDVPGPIDMVSFYVPPDIGVTLLEGVARKQIRELWLNPGAESPELIARARTLGLEPTVACSIIGVGEDPGAY